jgi:hypothetical protein
LGSVKDWRPNPISDEFPDGTRIDRWFDRGLLHRAGTPARVETWPDGTRVERWYEGGRMLASVLTTPGGERIVDEASIIEVPLPGGVSMAFVKIPPGTFVMGGSAYDDEKPIHQVTLARGFWMAVTEATQAQWKAVMGKNPSYLKGDPNLPVEQVSWHDCMEFVEALAPAAPKGLKFVLPTEAEWEYACRADSTTEWSFGTTNQVWRPCGSVRIRQQDPSGGQKRPNAWTLRHARNVWRVQGLVRALQGRSSPGSSRPGVRNKPYPARRELEHLLEGHPLCEPRQERSHEPQHHRGCAAGAALVSFESLTLCCLSL